MSMNTLATTDYKDLIELRNYLGLLYMKKKYTDEIIEKEREYDSGWYSWNCDNATSRALVLAIFLDILLIAIGIVICIFTIPFDNYEIPIPIFIYVGIAVGGCILGFLLYFPLNKVLERVFEDRYLTKYRKYKEKGYYDFKDTEEYKELNEKLNDTINAFVDTSIQRVEDLRQKFVSLPLDYSDWKYVDLILYYMSTHRADTIKEALLLVDTERRHQEIKKSLNEMNCSLGSISSQFSRINSQLGSIQYSLEGIRLTQEVSANLILDKLGDMHRTQITSQYRY